MVFFSVGNVGLVFWSGYNEFMVVFVVVGICSCCKVEERFWFIGGWDFMYMSYDVLICIYKFVILGFD